MVDTLPKDFLDHLCEDYGLEKILELHDIEEQFVLELLIDEGILDVADLYFDMEMADDE